MTRTTNAVVPLSEMQDRQNGDCFVLLEKKEFRQTRTGQPYYLLTIRDRSRQVCMRIWSDSEFFSPCEHEWSPGQFFKMRGTYKTTDWGPQFEPDKVRAVTEEDRNYGFDPANFVQRSRFDADRMFSELCELASREIDEQPMRELVLEILRRYELAIKQIPAATHNHHAYLGGFLEHVLSVTRTAVQLAEKYCSYYPDLRPAISKSLVVAGAILHDIGKLRELESEAHRAAYSAQGRLLGHMMLGRDIVREVAADLQTLSPDALLLLEHTIAAHQGKLEWAAVTEPQTIECLLVHYADDIDAKVNMMAQALTNDASSESFTSRDNPMRRRLYKGVSAKS